MRSQAISQGSSNRMAIKKEGLQSAEAEEIAPRESPVTKPWQPAFRTPDTVPKPGMAHTYNCNAPMGSLEGGSPVAQIPETRLSRGNTGKTASYKTENELACIMARCPWTYMLKHMCVYHTALKKKKLIVCLWVPRKIFARSETPPKVIDIQAWASVIVVRVISVSATVKAASSDTGIHNRW